MHEPYSVITTTHGWPTIYCHHTTTEIRQRQAWRGATTIIEQCLTCGRELRDLGIVTSPPQEIPMFDEGIALDWAVLKARIQEAADHAGAAAGEPE